MEKIGIVMLVQVQRSKLKIGERPNRIYNPAPLTQVDELILTADGIIGNMYGDPAPIIDVHNSQHPNSRNNQETNGISIGFTSHYTEMRQRFGEHLLDGVAGENIIVQTEQHISPELLGKQALFQKTNGEMVYLTNIFPAPPCIEFSRFAANRELTAVETKEILQFLDHGQRGYYASLNTRHREASVQPGDILFAM